MTIYGRLQNRTDIFCDDVSDKIFVGADELKIRAAMYGDNDTSGDGCPIRMGRGVPYGGMRTFRGLQYYVS